MNSSSDLKNIDWPHQGELFPAPQKRFEEIVLMVPFYMGHKKQLSKHIDFLNELGFDVLCFDLAFEHKDILRGKLPITASRKIGAKHVFAEQVAWFLNQLPGKKIIYSFSNPTAGVFEALAERGAIDVSAVIADSGPTNRFVPSAYQLYKHELGVHSLPLRLALTPVLSYLWSPFLHKDLHQHLEKLPKGFKILSIRGWKDKLIKPSHIDEVFEPHTHLDWQKLSLPEADHLNGLRDFPNDYKPMVERFLSQVATPISKV